jgi:acyl carrier protein phosphodiesterase
MYLTASMNFLAHLYLSGDNPKVKVGNFIGDFVKGKNLTERFDADVAKGIALHREIDWFTDTHAVVKKSKDRLRPKYRHYSGVIVDIFYDHFLAKNWGNYSSDLLPDFAEACYATIQQHEAILPEEAKYMMPYMINGNWLVNYSKLEGIQKALSGMARRTRFESKMEESVADLRENYEDFKKEFEVFFPDLIANCETWISQI